MTNKEYHERDEISASDLKAIYDCPLKWKYAKSNPAEPTEDMKLGTAIHTAVLEPSNYLKEISVLPKLDLRKKADKEIKAVFELANASKVILSEKQHIAAQETARAVLAHPLASQILTQEGARIEETFFWTDEDTGVKCRTRPDCVTKACIDLKSTKNASEYSFAKDSYTLKYHIQAAFYLDGLKANGIDLERFIFIAVEKVAPFVVQIYVADDSFIELGRMHYKQALKTLVKCRETGAYPAYAEGIQNLELPNYAE